MPGFYNRSFHGVKPDKVIPPSKDLEGPVIITDDYIFVGDYHKKEVLKDLKLGFFGYNLLANTVGGAGNVIGGPANAVGGAANAVGGALGGAAGGVAEVARRASNISGQVLSAGLAAV